LDIVCRAWALGWVGSWVGRIVWIVWVGIVWLAEWDRGFVSFYIALVCFFFFAGGGVEVFGSERKGRRKERGGDSEQWLYDELDLYELMKSKNCYDEIYYECFDDDVCWLMFRLCLLASC